MSGRENIWLYGNILGLTRAEVAARFDQIVAFSELSDVLDQQVKYYSSGMQLRLGFAIASHLDPDILIVDEALAVGDVRFQRRCLERMGALARAGTTIVYVSHDLRTVEALCDRVIWLDSGTVRADGPMTEILAEYLRASSTVGVDVAALHRDDDVLSIESVEILDGDGAPTDVVRSGGSMRMRMTFDGPEIESPQVAVGLSPGGIAPVIVCSMAEHGTAPDRVEGRWSCTLVIDHLPLRVGAIELWMGVLAADTMSDLVAYRRIATVAVDGPIGRGRRAATEIGPVIVPHHFEVTALDR